MTPYTWLYPASYEVPFVGILGQIVHVVKRFECIDCIQKSGNIKLII